MSACLYRYHNRQGQHRLAANYMHQNTHLLVSIWVHVLVIPGKYAVYHAVSLAASSVCVALKGSLWSCWPAVALWSCFSESGPLYCLFCAFAWGRVCTLARRWCDTPSCQWCHTISRYQQVVATHQDMLQCTSKRKLVNMDINIKLTNNGTHIGFANVSWGRKSRPQGFTQWVLRVRNAECKRSFCLFTREVHRAALRGRKCLMIWTKLQTISTLSRF